MTEPVDLVERYAACMVLGGAGDAIGFRNEKWEFCFSGKQIHKECKKLGGVGKLKVSLPDWRVSDDTVMHLATSEAFMEAEKTERCTDRLQLYLTLAKKYKESMTDMIGRSPGRSSQNGCWALKPILGTAESIQLPFDPKAGGCGAAMRAMCIGLRYPRPEQLDKLIAVSIESGRMTHHHPSGYLGALASALFISYAVQGKPTIRWGQSLLSTLPKAKEHVVNEGRHVKENVDAWSYFEDSWKNYLSLRHLTDGDTEPVFPNKYGVKERDAFYKEISFRGWGGASGHDAPMIAYDALLGCGSSWEELIMRGALHAGDSDSTATIACACYGAMYGFNGVPECNYKNLEYRKRLTDAGRFLHSVAQEENHSQHQIHAI